MDKVDINTGNIFPTIYNSCDENTNYDIWVNKGFTYRIVHELCSSEQEQCYWEILFQTKCIDGGRYILVLKNPMSHGINCIGFETMTNGTKKFIYREFLIGEDKRIISIEDDCPIMGKIYPAIKINMTKIANFNGRVLRVIPEYIPFNVDGKRYSDDVQISVYRTGRNPVKATFNGKSNYIVISN